MLKKDEAANPSSCWNKAKDGQMVFVIKEGDPAMRSTIEHWTGERLRLGCDGLGDAKIKDAEAICRYLRERE